MLFQDHVYLRDTYEFVISSGGTVVSGADGSWLAVLTHNPFHPQGGGQPSDAGTVNDIAVIPVRLGDGRVGVATAEPAGWADVLAAVRANESVTAKVDADTRLRHAALHTAGHLIHGLLHRRGFVLEFNNHFPGQARLTLQPPSDASVSDVSACLEAELAAAIDADHEVQIGYDGDTRLVTIAGIHTEPCGGTHVRSLRDLDAVMVRSVKRKGGSVKIGYDAAHRFHDVPRHSDSAGAAAATT